MHTKKENPCSVCNGLGFVAAGAWTTMSEATDCFHCKGTGEEPVKIVAKSSPFEDEGMGIGEG